MTSSNPPSREGPNQFRPSLRRAPGRRDRRGGEFVGGYVGRLWRHTRSLSNGKPALSSPSAVRNYELRPSSRQTRPSGQPCNRARPFALRELRDPHVSLPKARFQLSPVLASTRPGCLGALSHQRPPQGQSVRTWLAYGCARPKPRRFLLPACGPSLSASRCSKPLKAAWATAMAMGMERRCRRRTPGRSPGLRPRPGIVPTPVAPRGRAARRPEQSG